MPSRFENDAHATSYVRRQVTPSGVNTPASLSPDLQRNLSRRLAGVALSYSGAYLLAYGSEWVRTIASGQPDEAIFADVAAVLSIALGIAVFLAHRRRDMSPRAFANVTLAFMVLGAAGIMAGSWGWEQHFDAFQRHVYDAIGAPGLDFPRGFVDRLVGARTRIVYGGGVTWVGVWILVVTILVPMNPRRTLLGVVLAAATVPGLSVLSVAAHGVPPSMRPWMGDLLLDVTVPTIICAGLALFCSHTVYVLTRDLSRAQQLGSYQLVERIGAGGMGEVWRARHQLLRRPAAIKLIRGEMLSEPGSPAARDVMRRFEREAQATSLLLSPHTVDLYDFGIAPDGTFFYVMELLEGFDLKTLVERFGPLPASRATSLLQQVCHSLEDAHRSGLVHRDVKPSNIFTCRRGLDYDFVKVLDFGLVKHVAGGDETVDVSMEGVARGTPAYMAPEVTMGAGAADARSDIYAVGCVAYWMVTGKLVFEGPTPVATLLQHARDQPVPPSERLGAPVPAPFERLVLECLSKDPAARPQSAAALAARLAECADAIGPWTREEAESWWRTHAPAEV